MDPDEGGSKSNRNDDIFTYLDHEYCKYSTVGASKLDKSFAQIATSVKTPEPSVFFSLPGYVLDDVIVRHIPS